MKRQRFTVNFAVATVVALGLAGPVAAGEQVPFRGRFSGIAAAVSFNPPIAIAMAGGAGQATHLGPFVFQHPHSVNVVTFQLTGTFNLLAANGDEVFADFSGQAIATPTPGVRFITGTATITGGTGRFTGATGSFAIQRLFDSINSTTVGSFNGTISSPGAAEN